MIFSGIEQSIQQFIYDDISDSLIINHIKKLRESGNKDNIVTISKKYLTYDHSLFDIAELIVDHIKKKFKGQPYITGLNETVIINDGSDGNFITTVFCDGPGVTPIDKLKVDVTLTFVGDLGKVKNIAGHFDTIFRSSKARLSWYYATRDGNDSVSMYLPDPLPIYNEYYPWFPEGPKEYFKTYLESNSPILFLSGEPGVGKTSFLRAMVTEYNLNTFVGYDPKLFSSDGMFIDFLTSTNADLMILEDAETLVYPRKAENNTFISRLLNVSDGIIKLPRKKIVFTTNESGFTNVDEALLRPGRCHDSIEFRPLKYDEAIKAANKAGLTIPKKEKDYTLAALFNQGQKVKKYKIGF